MRGRKPIPRRGSLLARDGLPRCPPHLSEVARKEWRRLATPLFEARVLTLADRAALAAYCQAWARWVEAEEQLAKTPRLLKTPSGYVQQSPWLSVANRQMELMGRFMAELGLTPAARARVGAGLADPGKAETIEFVTIYLDKDGRKVETSLGNLDDALATAARSKRIGDPDLDVSR